MRWLSTDNCIVSYASSVPHIALQIQQAVTQDIAVVTDVARAVSEAGTALLRHARAGSSIR
eukprot:883286-Rhodomonas_salina.1